MFSSYILYDTVAIEAVYFPYSSSTAAPAGTPAASASIGTTETAADGHDGSASHNRHSSSSSSSSGATAAAVPRADTHDPPYQLTMRDVLLHRLTERYVGRVIPSRGLCVAVSEVLEYSASSVRGPAASAWLTATFSVCVFAPAPGTRLKARIAHQSSVGVYLTLDFVVAIPFLVPAALLVPGSRYSAAQRSWYLPLEGGDGDGVSQDVKSGAEAQLQRSGDLLASRGADMAADSASLASTATSAARTNLTAATTTAAAAAGSGGVGMSADVGLGAMAAPSVPHNKYLVGAEVVVKIVSCTVLSEEAAAMAAAAAEDDETGGSVMGGSAMSAVHASASVFSSVTAPSAGGVGVMGDLGAGCGGPPAVMELRGSFVGDALGPVSWFEDA